MTEILLAAVYALLFIWLLRRISFFHLEKLSRNTLPVLFIVKIISGVAFWAVYSFYSHYQNKADAFLYFEDGKAIYKALFENPLAYCKILLGVEDQTTLPYIENTGQWDMLYVQGIVNESRTIIRFNAIANIFSFGSYHVHMVFMCFLSLAGLTGIYKTFLPYLPDKKMELLVAVFLLPSVLFWGSGVLKEGLILFSSGMLVYHWFKFCKESFSVKRLIWIFFFGYFLLITKMYFFAILFPAFLAHLWIAKTSFRFPVVKYAVVYGVCAAGILVFTSGIPFRLMNKQRQNIYMGSGGTLIGKPEEQRFIYIGPQIGERIIHLPEKPGYCRIVPGVPYVSWYFDNFTDSVYVRSSSDTSVYWIYYNLEKTGSYIEIPLLYPSWSSVLKNSPGAFLTSAFRPHILEARNPMMLVSAVENIFILLFIFTCLLFFRKKLENRSLICFCFAVVVPLFVLIGLTTPVLGAVVRYKIPALPFLLIAFLFILDKEKLIQKLPFLKRFLA